MTVKALKRQLMAAIAMIMVSLVALSSSTYAWFTMNKTVTATGLTVKARTEGGILIKRTYGGTAADSVEFATGTAQSLPLPSMTLVSSSISVITPMAVITPPSTAISVILSSPL